MFENRLDRFWLNQEFKFDFRADITGMGSLVYVMSKSVYVVKIRTYRGLGPGSVASQWLGLVAEIVAPLGIRYRRKARLRQIDQSQLFDVPMQR